MSDDILLGGGAANVKDNQSRSFVRGVKSSLNLDVAAVASTLMLDQSVRRRVRVQHMKAESRKLELEEAISGFLHLPRYGSHINIPSILAHGGRTHGLGL